MESVDAEYEVRIVETTGNPALPGLPAFGMTVVMLNLHNAGLFSRGSMIFGLLVPLFLLLIMENATGTILILTIAGIGGIICGLSGLYSGPGQVVNEVCKEKAINIG